MRCIIVFLSFVISLNLFSQTNSKSTICEVTVYKDRALVTRLNETDVKSGINEIIFKNLPVTTTLDSLRAKGVNSKGSTVKILDIRIEKDYEVIEPLDLTQINKEISDAERQIESLNFKKERLKQQDNYLKNFSNKIFTDNIKETITVLNSNTQEQTKRILSSKEWDEYFEYYKKQKETLDESIIQIDNEIAEYENKIRILNDKYTQYQNKQAPYSTDAYVTFQSKEDSSIKMYLSYLAGNCTWTPAYDFRLDLESNVLTVEYYGKVFQGTGEDWIDVDLILSTARPDLGGTLPVVNPWNLDYYEYKDNYSFDNLSYKKMDKEYAAVKEETKKEVKEDRDEKAVVQSQGIAETYKIIQKNKIYSGRKDLKVTINSDIQLKPDIKCEIAPRYDKSAYLNGKIRNTSLYTLLDGSANVYINDSFISKNNITLTRPDQEFYFSFGKDPRIETDFKLEKQETGTRITKGFDKRKYLITINNPTNKDITVYVKDILPRSLQPKKISVKVLKIDPPQKEIIDESIYKWEIPIVSRGKAIITEEWEVEYPIEGNTSGL